MKLTTAIKRAKEQAGDNKNLLKLKLINIGLKYYRAYLHPEFKKEWENVVNENIGG